MDESLRKELSEINSSIAALEVNVKAAFKRIDEQKALVDSVHSLALSTERIAHKLDEACKDIGDMQRDVDAMKEKPGKRWDQVASSGIAAIVGSVVGAVLALVIKN